MSIGLCYIGRMIELTPEATTTATSPLGVVSLHAHGSSGVTLSVDQTEAPDLPVGMAVDSVIMFKVGIATPVTHEAPLLLAVALEHEGDAETGEWLESMAFRTDEGVLQVAVRDSEWLASKGIVAEHVEYKARGFSQTILEAAAGTTLYVSSAWRIGDRAATANDVSTWFAADLALPG